MKFTLLTTLTLLLSPFFSQGQSLKGSLKVVIENAEEDELLGAQVALYQGEKLINGAVTDPLGSAVVPDLEPGLYQMEIHSIGFVTEQRVVQVYAKITTSIVLSLKISEFDIPICYIGGCGREPLFKGLFGEMPSFETEEILKMPVR